MKVAFVTFPHSGHFNPMSALARRLQTRGHEAVLFSLPMAEAGARAARLPFVPFGQDPALDQALWRAGERISKSRGMEVFRHTLELMGAMLEAKRRELPGLFKLHGIEAVVVDDADWYAGTIPLQLGLPFAAVSCALPYDFSGRTPPVVYDWPHEATPAARKRNRRGAAELSKMARTVMAEPIAELEAAGLKMDWDDPSSLYANRLWITQCPREFDFEDSHRPAEFRHAGPFHDGGGRPEIAFPWERLTGAPLVYASMGTMLNGDPGVFRTILDAAARLPAAQLVLSVGQALRVGDLGPLPANAVVVNQAPQLPLLERASLTVTHAGLNTVLESLARGVPQVAIPVSYDQPGVAARIAHHGTGLVGSLDGLTAPGLAALVREALDNPSYRKNARQIQNAIRRTDGLSRAAELLEAGLSAPRPATARYEPTDEADAIVVGSGINGLVTAAELAQAGWSVILLERNVEIGGFIATEERTLPGYLHDTFSSWHPLFVSGPAYAGLGKLLHQHGLEYRNADGWVTASVADDGRSTFAHRDPELTVAEFSHAEDRAAYLGMLQRLGQDMASIGGLLGSEVRSLAAVRHMTTLVRRGGVRGAEWWLRAAASSGRAYLRRDFRGHEVDHLYAPWLLHAGLSPDHASGGLMTPMFAGILHGVGLPVVAGGAGRFVAAFRSLLDSLRVQIETGCEVDRILVTQHRAVGVEAAGRTFRARRAVIASVTPNALYNRLLPKDAIDAAVQAEAASFRPGRAALQVHVALSEPLGWRDTRLAEVPLIHLSDGSASTGIACAEAEAGLLPRRPTVVVGQQYLLDPTRVPAGAAALWLQLQEVPYTPCGDAAGELDTTHGWTKELAEGYADRVLDRVARHAPDLRDKILAIDILTPEDLRAHNPNAINGDPYGGSAELDQSLLWRPLASSGRHATAIDRLWHIGASTHPGAGLGGVSGHVVATALIRRRAWRR